jgi:hypothetical protein
VTSSVTAFEPRSYLRVVERVLRPLSGLLATRAVDHLLPRRPFSHRPAIRIKGVVRRELFHDVVVVVLGDHLESRGEGVETGRLRGELSASVSAPRTMRARAWSAGSVSWYVSRNASNEHRSP